jgi:hypothetical protein
MNRHLKEFLRKATAIVVAATLLSQTVWANTISFIGNATPTAGQSGVFAYWNFNGLSIATASGPGAGGVPTTMGADFAGNGSATLSLAGWTGLVDDFGGSTINAQSGDVAGASLSPVSSAGNGSYFQFSFSMAGLESLAIDFARRGTSTGFTTGLWSYSTDGTTFTQFGSNTATTSTTFGSATQQTTAALNGAATAYLRYTLSGATNTSGNNRIDNLTFTATMAAGQGGGGEEVSNSSVLSLPANSSFGRVMTNGSASVQLSNVGTATTWAASATGGFTPTSSGSIAADGTTAIAIGVGSTLGSRSGTLTVDNAATTSAAAGQGSAQADISSSLSATVVQNRQLGLTAAPGVGVTDNVINVGKVLVGTVASGSGTLTTSGADSENTRVTLAANQNVDFTSGTDPRTGGTGVYARMTTPGSAVAFNAADVTAAVSGQVAYGTSGLKTSNYANLASSNVLSGEGLTGESVRSARVYFSADVYQAASVGKGSGQSGTVANGGTVSVTNAAASDGGQRAGAAIASKTLTGDSGWSVAGLTVGTQIAAGGTSSTTASFDATGRLNGTYLADLVVGLEHADQTIAGTAANDLGSLSWELSHHVAGQNGGGSAGVKNGQSYSSFNTNRGSGKNSSVSFAAGTASGNKHLSIAFSDAPTTGGTFVSDVLQLEGTGSDPIVLEIGYDAAALSLGTEQLLTLNWLDTREGSLTNGDWILSVIGNDYSGGGSTAGSSFLGSWASYVASNPGATAASSLGRYGVDTEANKVWAVINHNSEFVVAVPEPATLLLGGVGLVLAGLGIWKRRQPIAKQQAA